MVHRDQLIFYLRTTGVHSPFSLFMTLGFLPSRAAKLISSPGPSFSSSSPNSIFTTTFSVYSYKNEVRKKGFFPSVTKNLQHAKNHSRTCSSSPLVIDYTPQKLQMDPPILLIRRDKP